MIEAAKAAGAEYVVKVSGGRAVTGPNVESVNGRAHYRDRGAPEELRPAMVHPQPRSVHAEHAGTGGEHQEHGKIVQPWPKDLPVALIDVRDTGALGARVLRDPGKHAGKVYSFTGLPRPTASSPT